MGKYDQDTQSALLALKEAGKAVSLSVSVTPEDYDPVEGVDNAVPEVTTVDAVLLPASVSKFKNMDVRFEEGTLVIAKAKYILMAGLDTAGQAISAVPPGSTVTSSGVVYSVVASVPIDPDDSGSPILFKIAAIRV